MSLVTAICALVECGRKFTYDPAALKGTSFPFCSPLCRGVDLGHWVDEDYTLPSLPDLRGIEDEDDGVG